ncbi:hypothetical protein [Longispora albida]|uniref:hypothetical protein n=1 Tax=Longispora albida TaxID=203523 RepID=UPI000368DF58|nr:hypothetical protein [Longispora albida]
MAGTQRAILAALLGTAVGVVPFIVYGIATSASDGTTLVQQGAEFESQGRDAVIKELERASAAQGICYGWKLQFSNSGARTSTDSGSNLGSVTRIDNDKVKCPKWVELDASVTWTSDSSESEDYGSVTIRNSPGLKVPSYNELTAAGITKESFIDAPAEAMASAMLKLPLLMTEKGATPVPVVSSTPSTPLPKMTSAGSDLWRDNVVAFAFAAGFLGMAGGLLIGGWREKGIQVREAAIRAAEAERKAARQAATKKKQPKGGGGPKTPTAKGAPKKPEPTPPPAAAEPKPEPPAQPEAPA